MRMASRELAVVIRSYADPKFNAEHTIDLARRVELGAAWHCSLELGISAYSNEDLFHQDVLLDATRVPWPGSSRKARSRALILVGAPLRFEGSSSTALCVIYRGLLLGIVPKTFLPNYRGVLEKAAI
jgi:NAD+ synthase (glutamine-hydrolysing)